MEAMMKKSLYLIAALLLVGCQSNNGRHPNRPFKFPTALEIQSQCESQIPAQAASRDTNLWLCQVVTAIQYRFFDADKYQGKTCDLVIMQPLGKLPVSITSKGGDPDLCVAAIEATKQAIESNTFSMRPAYLKDEIPMRFAP
jgi:outer membrane biogenesis lipoprotein LolB